MTEDKLSSVLHSNKFQRSVAVREAMSYSGKQLSFGSDRYEQTGEESWCEKSSSDVVVLTGLRCLDGGLMKDIPAKGPPKRLCMCLF